MTTEKLGALTLAAALFAVGALAWWLQTRPALAVDASPLASLPRDVGPWRSVEVPLESTVESILRADFNLQRAYFPHIGAEPVFVYIGYYGTDRGGRPEHTPRGCYTGAGWDIASARALEVADGSELRVNEWLVERGAGERQLVHFWYRSRRRTGMLGGLDQRLDQILGRFQQGRADGALVRLSTRLGPDGEVAARGRLVALGGELDRQLAQHWPVERPRIGG
jgi:EpsI family protein